jgi:hypothetical protein
MSTTPSAFPVAVRSLGRWRLIEQFQERLAAVASKQRLAPTFSDPQRQLQLGQYLGLFLFGLLNPAVRTMRALCAASDLERLQKEVCGRAVSLGSFSEAQAVVDPALLEELFGQWAQEAAAAAAPGRSRPGLATAPWLIVDSTLWEALPRMHWALWRRQGTIQRAVRLHVGFHLLEDTPARVRITPGRGCERQAWRSHWQPGEAYIGDRYYGEDYGLFGELEALGCTFILRLREPARIHLAEELPLSAADRQANVLRQAWVTLGSKSRYRSGRVRLVWVQTPKEVLVLVTNQAPADLSAELVAALYRQRWQVELFFRWIKCILGCRHWLAESSQGVALQIYLALIAALLLQLHSGRRPTRRMLERIELYLLGVATLQELETGLARELARLARQAKNKKA